MESNPKIYVFKLKEIIYAGMLVVLSAILLYLLFNMF